MTTTEDGMSYEYQPGEKVAVNRYTRFELDTVKRVTEASVITEDNGVFARKRMHADGSITKNLDAASGWGAFVTLYPLSHPRAVRAFAAKRQERRELGRRNARTSDAVSDWVRCGTADTLAAAIAELQAAQDRYGEPGTEAADK